MRANLPKNPPLDKIDLEGIYLQAMKDASVRLMDVLPAGDDLWNTLGQIEAMLLEAQRQEMPLNTLFGDGGVAAFCQSIVDEYRESGEALLPASLDHLTPHDKRLQGPQGDINFKRHRVKSIILAWVLSVAFACLALWYTGIFRYWTAGDSYYLEELHNFQSTVTVTLSDPFSVTMPLKRTSGLHDVLYSDAEGYEIVLTYLEPYDRSGSYTDPDTGKMTYRPMKSWILGMTYTVRSDFKQITYVEPSSGGTVTVTLADGTVYNGKITWMESGSAGDGAEYARISVIELPSDLDTTGATLTVVLDPPKRVEWNRISTGYR